MSSGPSKWSILRFRTSIAADHANTNPPDLCHFGSGPVGSRTGKLLRPVPCAQTRGAIPTIQIHLPNTLGPDSLVRSFFSLTTAPDRVNAMPGMRLRTGAEKTPDPVHMFPTHHPSIRMISVTGTYAMLQGCYSSFLVGVLIHVARTAVL